MRIGIAPSTFAQEDKTPLELLQRAGATVIPNPTGKRLSEVEVTDYLVSQRLDGLLAGLEPLNRRVLEAARPTLKAVARVGIGITNVDVIACRDLGIAFSYTPDGPTEAVAEMTLAALLSLARDLEPMNRALHAGQWPKQISRSLRELTVLVIGFGRIGRAVARQLSALGCTILVCDPYLLRMPHASSPKWTSTPALHRPTWSRSMQVATGQCWVLPSSLPQSPASSSSIQHVASSWMRRPSWPPWNPDGSPRAGLTPSGRNPTQARCSAFPGVLLTPHACTYTRRCRLQMETEAARNILRDLGKA